MKNASFMEVLASNNQEEMKQFLQSNGKVKPRSAIYFVPKKKGEIENGRRENNNEGIDGRDSGDNKETEVC
jgi:hypothetical protein